MKKKNRPAALFLLGVCLLPLSGLAFVPLERKVPAPPAEGKAKPYALIFGTVFDSRNLAVYGVQVKIRQADKKKPVWEQISNHNGEFAQRVPPGPLDYVVWAEVKGPNGKAKIEKTVHVYFDERVDVYLHLEDGQTPK